MKKIKFLVICLISMFLFASPLLAVEDEDVRYPGLAGQEPFQLSDMIREPIDNLELDLFAGSSLGYDQNVYLDHYDRVSSFFTENIFSADARYPMPVFDWIKLRLGYDVTHLKYFRDSDADLLNNIVKGGVETVLYDVFTFDALYTLDIVNYPNDEQSDYYGQQIEVGATHDITDWLYQRISWQYLMKDYTKRKARSRIFTAKLGDREDTRHTFEHDAGLTIFDSTMLKLTNKIYVNDSNYDYNAQYEYGAYKITGSLIHLITDRISGRASFGYQMKDYQHRNISDAQEKQLDHLFIYGGSLLYDITPALSLGVNYTYRRNVSNENSQQYGGSVISSGLYYSF